MLAACHDELGVARPGVRYVSKHPVCKVIFLGGLVVPAEIRRMAGSTCVSRKTTVNKTILAYCL